MKPLTCPYTRHEFLARTGRLAAATSGVLLLSHKSALATRAPSSTADPIASRAISAAKRFEGTTLRFSPLWEDSEEAARLAAEWTDRTSVKVEVDTESPDVFAPFFSYLSLPDLAESGQIVPIDGLIKKHGATASLRDYHPLARSGAVYRGQTWGFPDDLDVWPLTYRKDVFADSKLRRAYRAAFKRDLRVPRTWEEFAETARFISHQRAPAVYGTTMGREPFPGFGSHVYFYGHFQGNGGRFFDLRTMRASINGSAGARAVEQILAENAASVPAVHKLDYVDIWGLWMQGRTAMLPLWAPIGRMSENVQRRTYEERFIPRSRVAGNVGYTTIGPYSLSNGGFLQSVAAKSKHREAAYLFAQWLTSPSVSLARVHATSKFDPPRVSHYRSAELYRPWPAAREHKKALCEAANRAMLPLTITGGWEYAGVANDELRQIYRGKDVQAGLDAMATKWDAITDRLGVDKQRRSYQSFLKMTGSSRETTAAAKGLAVRC